VSRDGGCSFTTALADVAILGLVIGATGEVWASTGKSGVTNDVFVSHDHGETFAPTGLASSEIYWSSLAIAPGDPTRVYAAGYEIGGAVHLRRRDGDSWVVVPGVGITLGTPGRLVIAAIAPHDPDVVYVVSEGALAPAGDRLFRSEDGGMTFAEVYAIDGLIRDVVAPDAQRVIVTVLVQAGPAYLGGTPSISTDGGRTFEPYTAAPTLRCLTVAPDGTMLGCGANWDPDFMAIARFDGTTWSKVWRFVELSAPLSCAPRTGGHDVCDPGWPALDEVLRTSGPVCGPHVRDPGIPDLPPPPVETCCGASNHPASWVWTLVVAWRLRRRRRRVR